MPTRRDATLSSWVKQGKYSLWDFGHLLQRVANLHCLGFSLSQGLFSSSQHIIATNHQCIRSCSVSVLPWPNGSYPCSSLQRWHCQGLLTLLPNVSSKAFHCFYPQVLRDEYIYLWYWHENSKHLRVFYQWVMNIVVLSDILLWSTFTEPVAESERMSTPA